jgi:hypothetical protein
VAGRGIFAITVGATSAVALAGCLGVGQRRWATKTRASVMHVHDVLADATRSRAPHLDGHRLDAGETAVLGALVAER